MHMHMYEKLSLPQQMRLEETVDGRAYDTKVDNKKFPFCGQQNTWQ